MSSDRRLVIWAYLVEILCAGLLEAAILFAFPPRAVAEFVVRTALAWATLTGGLFAASIAIWVVLFQMAATNFGEWMERRGALKVFSFAFVTAAGIYGAATALLVVASYLGLPRVISYLALYALLLAALSTYSMLRNGVGLLQLQSEFRLKTKQQPSADKTSEQR